MAIDWIDDFAEKILAPGMIYEVIKPIPGDFGQPRRVGFRFYLHHQFIKKKELTSTWVVDIPDGVCIWRKQVGQPSNHGS